MFEIGDKVRLVNSFGLGAKGDEGIVTDIAARYVYDNGHVTESLFEVELSEKAAHYHGRCAKIVGFAYRFEKI